MTHHLDIFMSGKNLGLNGLIAACSFIYCTSIISSNISFIVVVILCSKVAAVLMLDHLQSCWFSSSAAETHQILTKYEILMFQGIYEQKVQRWGNQSSNTEHVTFLSEFRETNNFYPVTGAATTPDLFQQNSENTVYIVDSLLSCTWSETFIYNKTYSKKKTFMLISLIQSMLFIAKQHVLNNKKSIWVQTGKW